ncbi:MAG: tRNA 2-thiouridine(34) synthase MnmA, partial [Candidatus Marinimicrobia bacterium]|nr:tRNA 2-thiouridine(34) synthase MnmA [Candidatus Neomarinimicrobiota bacterium]
TGHYAQVEQSGGYKLLKGVDDGKDQSYFLWTLGQDQLPKTMFPVGGYKKEYVRKLAHKFGLPTETKKDSQGVCFLGKIDMKDFLKHYIDEKKGDVINEKGDVIGWHSGSVFFTLGERHGFTITKKGTDDKPYYIIAKNIDNNTLIVSDTPEESISERKEIIIEKTNWITDVPKIGEKPARIGGRGGYQARIRHLGELRECEIISIGKGNATLKFHKALLASPGQSLVLYDGEECLGGGIIR